MPSREEINQGYYGKAAAHAAYLVAKAGPEFKEQFRRIAKRGPEAIDIADQLRRDFLDICDCFDADIATDMFEYAIASYRLKHPARSGRGRPRGPSDDLRDDMLLDLYAAAKIRKIPGHPEVRGKTKLALFLESKGWGPATTIEQRLTKLVNRHNKRKKLSLTK